MRTKDKIVVQDSKRLYTEVLTSVDFDSFQWTWQKNGELQLDFTAYGDGSAACELLTVENSVWYQDQEYILKQPNWDYKDGQEVITATATHVFYQLGYRRQRAKNDGAHDYTIESALDYLLNGLNTGFSYQIHGQFGTKSMTDFGNCSLTDGISTIMETFNVYAYYPDNKVAHFYDEDSFCTMTDNVFRYRNNTEEVQMNFDSTTIVNTVVASSSVTRDVTTTTTTDGQGQDKITVMINWGESQKGAFYSSPSGRTGPNSYDCSGFVWCAMKNAGFSVPSYAWATPAMNNDITGAHTYFDQIDLNAAQRGDVVVTGGPNGGGALGHTFILLEAFHGDATKVLQCSGDRGVNDVGTYQYASVDGQVVVGRPKGVTQSSTETDTTQVPMFDPFTVVNEESVSRWGECDGDDVTSDTIDNPDDMRKFALSQMQSEPVTTLSVTMANGDVPNRGEKWTLQVIPASYQTVVEAVEIQKYPMSSKPAQVTLNNLQRNFFDSLSANQRQLTKVTDRLTKIQGSSTEPMFENAMITDPDLVKTLKQLGGV